MSGLVPAGLLLIIIIGATELIVGVGIFMTEPGDFSDWAQTAIIFLSAGIAYKALMAEQRARRDQNAIEKSKLADAEVVARFTLIPHVCGLSARFTDVKNLYEKIHNSDDNGLDVAGTHTSLKKAMEILVARGDESVYGRFAQVVDRHAAALGDEAKNAVFLLMWQFEDLYRQHEREMTVIRFSTVIGANSAVIPRRINRCIEACDLVEKAFDIDHVEAAD